MHSHAPHLWLSRGTGTEEAINEWHQSATFSSGTFGMWRPPQALLRVIGENRVSKNHATRMIVGRVLYEVSKIAPNPRSASCPAFVARCSISLANPKDHLLAPKSGPAVFVRRIHDRRPERTNMRLHTVPDAQPPSVLSVLPASVEASLFLNLMILMSKTHTRELPYDAHMIIALFSAVLNLIIPRVWPLA